MSDTMQVQPSLTIVEVMTIIESCEHILRFVQASVVYKQIEASERFTTTNDLKMGDAVQALVEINQAIVNFDFDRQDEEIEDALNSTFTA
jgi:exosome complex RNA-binding protein Csl4